MKTQIRTTAEFLDWVPQVRKRFGFVDDEPWQPWFRGQRADWQLLPKLYRDDQYGDAKRLKKYRIEDEILEEFIIRAPALSEGIPSPSDDWGWLFLMQHFGAPTRLLDWTEGALLALYFAVKDNPGCYDAAVWALDPYELNRRVIKKEWIIPPSAAGVSGRDKKRVEPWLPCRFKRRAVLPLLPVAVGPSHTVRRISTQRSCFTVHGADKLGFDKLEQEGPGYLTKVTIPAYRVEAVRKELEASGIDESTIFPDLAGLGKSLHLKWLDERKTLPHRDVYTRLRPSTIHGVGVFAIRKIKKGTSLFGGDNEEMLWVEERRLPRWPREVRRLYEDFPVIKEGRYGCPKNFNRLTMSWYLNEPEKGTRPNVGCDPITYDFSALWDILAGEELTVDYGPYSERPNVDDRRKEKRR